MRQACRIGMAILLIAAFTMPPALAEVMDKEPTLSEIWAAGITGMLLAGIAAYIRPLFG